MCQYVACFRQGSHETIKAGDGTEGWLLKRICGLYQFALRNIRNNNNNAVTSDLEMVKSEVSRGQCWGQYCSLC